MQCVVLLIGQCVLCPQLFRRALAVAYGLQCRLQLLSGQLRLGLSQRLASGQAGLLLRLVVADSAVCIIVLLRNSSKRSQRVAPQVGNRAADTLRIVLLTGAEQVFGSTRRMYASAMFQRWRYRRQRRHLQDAESVRGKHRPDGVQHFGKVGILAF